MSDKFISADAIKAKLNNSMRTPANIWNDVYNAGLYQAEKIIDFAPAVDAVEVVRCRECRHYHQYYAGNFREATGWGKCTLINMDIDMTVGDYCSHGERRMKMRLIDADAAKKILESKSEMATGTPKEVFLHVAKMLDLLSTIESEPIRHGEWKTKHNPITDPKGYFIRIVCSECNLHTGQRSNYCPQCGAKMDGKENADG